MCGIVGQWSRDRAADAERVRAAAGSIRHRGPDGEGVWTSTDGRVALAHRRLAIIDLSPDASQPMVARDSPAAVVFNGEIYNYREVRRELEGLGRVFTTQSDTEVLLTAYLEWGDACVDRLVGMFAFCIADADRRELFLARDRAGEKPLYYRSGPDGFAFASELKALMSLPGTGRVLDRAALNHYLALGYVPGDQCIIEGVRKLRPGHALRVRLDDGAVRCWRYWTLPAERAPSSDYSIDDAATELERLLGDAVRGQLVADVPIGVLLSGGLDSSLVTALAARSGGPRVRTFSVGFPGHRGLDETEHARLVARAFDTDHTEIAVTPASADVFRELAAQYDEPLADSSIIPTYLLARAVRERVTVALGGDGGDELFGGYPHHSWMVRFERLKRRVPARARRALAGVAQQLPTGVRGRNHLIGFGHDLGEAIARSNLYFDAAMRRRLLRDVDADWRAPERLRAAAGGGATTVAGRVRRADFHTYLPDDILVKVDRASMLASLEVRAPFLDHRVCEFAFALPDGFTATADARKVVPRRLAERLLPPEFNAVRKQGFSIPLSAWLRGEWGGLFEDALDALPRALIDPGAVHDVLRSARAGLANSHRVFALAVLSLWCEHYGVTAP